MAVVIEMPKLSDTMTEGTLVKWLKKVGDPVEMGDVLAEVETDKATMEMEAFDEGVVHAIYIREGEKVAVGGRMALLLSEGEEPPSGGQPATGPSAAPPAQVNAAAPGPASSADAPAEAAPARAPGERVKASPLARKLARERGIALETIAGSGPGGRILKRDVLSARPTPAPAAGGPAPAAPPPAAPVIRASAGEGDQRIPLTGMRRIIADRLLASKTQIPHFYAHIDIDAAPMMDFRRQLNAGSEGRPDANNYTVNDFILKAVIQSCLSVPEVNSAFDGDAILRFASVHLSVAIALEEGLVTPVIRDAQTKSLLQLSLAVKDLAVRARGKKLSPDEFQGGTVTVSNLGAHGIRSFDAIINPPQSFIIAVGAVTRQPVVDSKGELVAGQRVDIGMSCDHRVIDGAVAARYLGELRRYLENPALMLL